MSAPPLGNASTTSVPSVIPLTMRFLRGKCGASGAASIANSETTAPFSHPPEARRIDHIDTRSKHGDGLAANAQGSFVRGKVDPIREARDHNDPCLSKCGSEIMSGAFTIFGGSPCADYRHGRTQERVGVTLRPQINRRIVDLAEQRRVRGRSRQDELCAFFLGGFKLMSDLLPIIE